MRYNYSSQSKASFVKEARAYAKSLNYWVRFVDDETRPYEEGETRPFWPVLEARFYNKRGSFIFSERFNYRYRGVFHCVWHDTTMHTFA
jgi:hypothetical protein